MTDAADEAIPAALHDSTPVAAGASIGGRGFATQRLAARSAGAVTAGWRIASSLDGVRAELRIVAWIVVCVITGHAVPWGPCPRCHRRAVG